MEPNESQQPPQAKSSRTFEEWKAALIKIISANHGKPPTEITIDDKRIQPYYDRALMPSVCYNELFNQ